MAMGGAREWVGARGLRLRPLVHGTHGEGVWCSRECRAHGACGAKTVIVIVSYESALLASCFFSAAVKQVLRTSSIVLENSVIWYRG